MTQMFSEDDVVTIVTRLTRTQLVRFIEVDLVRPDRGEVGYFFREADIARLELLCDLSEDLELDETGAGIVISLIDQLHAARQDLATVARAIRALPEDLQSQLMAEVKRR